MLKCSSFTVDAREADHIAEQRSKHAQQRLLCRMLSLPTSTLEAKIWHRLSKNQVRLFEQDAAEPEQERRQQQQETQDENEEVAKSAKHGRSKMNDEEEKEHVEPGEDDVVEDADGHDGAFQ